MIANKPEMIPIILDIDFGSSDPVADPSLSIFFLISIFSKLLKMFRLLDIIESI